MEGPSPGEVTRLLAECREGKAGALDRLMPLVYGELRRLAAHYMRGERKEHTLQPTALVHEAYGRLVGQEITWRDRAQFFKAAAQSMRRILVDHARAKRSAKRGGGQPGRPLDEAVDVVTVAGGGELSRADLVDLDRALARLGRQDARKARVVELHFFGGLSFDEVARTLEISKATVDRDMRFARAWLREALTEGAGDGP
jgi:RNA polymerase sigma factor (TIGR02999 family)